MGVVQVHVVTVVGVGGEVERGLLRVVLGPELQAAGLAGQIVDEQGAAVRPVARCTRTWSGPTSSISWSPVPISSHSRSACRVRSNQVSRLLGVEALVGHVDPLAGEGAVLDQRGDERAGVGPEKPAPWVPSRCMGVRIASRSGRSRRSPMPISSPYRITGGAGHSELQAVGQLDPRRSPPSIGASRRRMPRPYSCMSGSGANVRKTSCRSSSVSRPQVDLVVVAQERGPLAVPRQIRQLAERGSHRAPVLASQRQYHCLVEAEREHH